MTKNIGIEDRIIRFVILDLIFGIPFYGWGIPEVWSNISFMVVIALGITILTGYSPVYQLFGFNTVYNNKCSEAGNS